MISFFKALLRLIKSSGDAVDGMGSETTALLKNINDILCQPGVKENISTTIESLPKLINDISMTVQDSRPLLLKSLEQVMDLTKNINTLMESLNGQARILSDRKTLEALDECVQKFPGVMSFFENLLEEQVGPSLVDMRLVIKETHGSLKDVRELLAKASPVTDALTPESNSMVSKLLHEDGLYQHTQGLLKAVTDLMVMLEAQPNAVIFGNRSKKKQ